MANKKGRGRTWRDIDNTILKKYWNSRSIEQLCNTLNRSEQAVKRQAAQLGLEQKPRVNAVPDDIFKFVIESAGKLPVKQIAKETGYSEAGIYQIFFRNDISLRAISAGKR